MRAEVEVKAERPELLYRCLGPSLVSDDNVSYSLDFDEEGFEAVFKAGTVSHLRGSSDTVFRLLSLSKKLLER